MRNDIYAQLLAGVPESAVIKRVLLGLSWSAVEVDGYGVGLCFSPLQVARTLSWPGTLAGRKACDLGSWINHWDAAEAVIGQATINAVLNHASPLSDSAQLLSAPQWPAHLQVFGHFAPQLTGQNVVVIGHYPGLEKFCELFRYTCIERNPRPGDLPDTAAEYLLPEADWVFITATSLANKTLPRLLQLAADATVVLMGPSLPWAAKWQDYGVDYLAGIRIMDEQALWQVIAEGGGTRLFDRVVRYCLLPL